MKKSELKFLIAAILKESAHMNRRERRAMSNQLANMDTKAGEQHANATALNYLQKTNPQAAYKIAAERQRRLTLQGMAANENTGVDIPSEMIKQSLIKQIRQAEAGRKMKGKNLDGMDLGALQKYYNSIGQFDSSVHVPGHGWGGVNENNEQPIFKDRQGGQDVYWMDNKDSGGKIQVRPEAVARMVKRGHRVVDLNEPNDPRAAKRQPDPDMSHYTDLQEDSSNESFFPRLDLALNNIEEFLDKNKATVDDNEHPKDENADRHGVRKPFAYGGIPYEQSRDAHYKLLSYKGKLTRKYLHVSIYRMPSGSYELTKYIA